MALIKCPDCGRDVSSEAAACLGCGRPVKPPTPAYQSPSHSQPENAKSTKSRGTFIILGLVFGCLGFHNFYAGYYGKGAAQLIITLVLGWVWIGIIITGLWALIEIITITEDAEEYPFS